jgi:aconitate hydratase
MGVLPLQYRDGENAISLGLAGTEVFSIEGLGDGSAREVTVTAQGERGDPVVFRARVRIDTPKEREYFLHGGILHYVLRQLAGGDQAAA